MNRVPYLILAVVEVALVEITKGAEMTEEWAMGTLWRLGLVLMLALASAAATMAKTYVLSGRVSGRLREVCVVV